MANLNIYLLATYVARPKNPRQTSRAGYITDPSNIQYDENLEQNYINSHIHMKPDYHQGDQ